jgi:hypothetical protein
MFDVVKFTLQFIHVKTILIGRQLPHRTSPLIWPSTWVRRNQTAFCCATRSGNRITRDLLFLRPSIRSSEVLARRRTDQRPDPIWCRPWGISWRRPTPAVSSKRSRSISFTITILTRCLFHHKILSPSF